MLVLKMALIAELSLIFAEIGDRIPAIQGGGPASDASSARGPATRGGKDVRAP